MLNEKENVYIVRCGEVALKGQNKPYFERMLVQKIKKILKGTDGISVERTDGLIFVRTPLDIPREDILKRVGRVFGVDSISPASEVDITGLNADEALAEAGRVAVEIMNGIIASKGIKTFKIEARRADKAFPVESPQIARRIGASVLKGCKVLKVDVHEPDALAVCLKARSRALDGSLIAVNADEQARREPLCNFRGMTAEAERAIHINAVGTDVQRFDALAEKNGDVFRFHILKPKLVHHGSDVLGRALNGADLIPIGLVPELGVVVRADDGHFPAEMDRVAQGLREQDAALRIELDFGGIGEHGAQLALQRIRQLVGLVAQALPVRLVIRAEARLTRDGDIERVAELLAELGRDEQTALGVQRMLIGAGHDRPSFRRQLWVSFETGVVFGCTFPHFTPL